MKRELTFGLMLTCAFALTNCSEQIVPPVIEDDQIVEEAPSTELESEDASIPFEVYATTAETKTAANGNRTDWSVRDSINVFHSHNGGFSNDGAFAIRDVAEGLFGGRLNQPLADGQSHNWYFIYPYSSSNTTPTSATVTIGASKDENGKYVQVQHEANSKEHLAGPNYPMWGKTTTAANETPKMNVEHLSSVVALKVCNDGAGEDVYIKTLSFSVPKYTEYEEDGKTVKKTHQSEAIVGKFTFDATTSISYAPVDKETSDITTISLTTPIYLPKDSDITIYLAIKPFVADNRYVKVSINGSERGANISANFQPGKVTTLKVSVKPPKYETESDALKITSKGRLSGDTDINLINHLRQHKSLTTGTVNLTCTRTAETGIQQGLCTIQSMRAFLQLSAKADVNIVCLFAGQFYFDATDVIDQILKIAQVNNCRAIDHNTVVFLNGFLQQLRTTQRIGNIDSIIFIAGNLYI